MERLPKDQRTIIITGPRQSGKTTLMKQIRDQLKKGISPLPTFFFNLEDMDYLTAFDQSPKNLLKLIPRGKKVIVFVDEVQYLKNPSNFLKYIYDEHKENIKLIVSGSSAFYMDTKFDDSLSGRKWLHILYPMGFKEFLYFSNDDIYEQCITHKVDVYQPAIRREIEALFEEYVLYGGYPEVVTSQDIDYKKEILNDIIHSYLKKDIKDAGIKYIDKFYNVLKLLASQVGNLVNKNELALIGAISQTAVENYLNLLKRTFYISLISPFFTKASKEIARMPKIYFFDTGIRNMVLKNFSELELRLDKGSLMENVVFKYFSESQTLEDIKFWRKKAGAEIDFVINNKAYEVKYSLGTLKTQQLQSFKASHPGIDLSVLFYKDKKDEGSKTNYFYIPEFLLHENNFASGDQGIKMEGLK
jgi:predicted AAA+ superfamily ATPase